MLVWESVVAVYLLNFNGRQEPSFLFSTLSDDGESDALFRRDLPPDPIEVELARLHNFAQDGIHIVDGHVRFVLLVTMIDERTTHEVNEVGLIGSQLSNLYQREWIKLKKTFHW